VLLCAAVITVFVPTVCYCVLLCATVCCCVLLCDAVITVFIPTVCYCVLLCDAVIAVFIPTVCCCVLQSSLSSFLLCATVCCSHQCVHSYLRLLSQQTPFPVRVHMSGSQITSVCLYHTSACLHHTPVCPNHMTRHLKEHKSIVTLSCAFPSSVRKVGR